MSAVLRMQAAVMFVVEAAGTPCMAVDVHAQSRGAEKLNTRAFQNFYYLFIYLFIF